MKYELLTSNQRSQWSEFVNALSDLNHRFARSRFDLWQITKMIDIFKSSTEALPPSFNVEEIGKWKKYASSWMSGVTRLNNAFSLSQSGAAYLQPSSFVSGDLDMIVDANVTPEKTIHGATFNEIDLPSPELGIAPLIPILVKAGVMITGIVIVSGIVKSVNSTIVKHQKIELALARIKTGIERDMKDADPKIYEQWAGIKKNEITPAKAGFLSSLGGNMGSVVGIGLVAVVGYFIWQSISKKEGAS